MLRINSIKKVISIRYTVMGVMFIAGFLISYFWGPFPGEEHIVQNVAPFREISNSYKFINPLLFYEVPNSNNSPIYLPLVSKLENIAANFEKQEKNGQISVYFRNLNRGQWIGVGEDKTYTPSSLLKVVIMIAYFKEMESHPLISSQFISFSQDIKNIMETVPYDRGTNLVLGQKYSVDDLINRMIIDSDNGATYALSSQINDSTLNQIYYNLNIKNPVNAGRTYTITPLNYVAFLRILYNATYLDRTMSEKALALLSRTNFQDGIASGIPRQIKIAHKYGETVSIKDAKTVNFVELHDCGIIYHPRNPYILCVMSRGTNLEDLSSTLKTISANVYQYINSN